MNKWFVSWGVAFTLTITVAFAYGVGVGKYKWFPHDIAMQAKYFLINKSTVEFDGFGRLVKDSSKTLVNCPEQSEDVGVFLAIGQSNSANHADYKYKESELLNVYNYFNGKCYKASSPLLGATGADGEWISKAASNVIKEGIYKKIVIISSGIADTRIVRWAEGNDLNKMLISVLSEFSPRYTITEVIWHQGESDRRLTFSSTYEEMFKSLLNTLYNYNVKAPVFMSIASVCGDNSIYPNRITEAQNNLILISGVEIGVNTDELIGAEKRYDKCHFGKEGEEQAAHEIAKIITAYRK